MAATSTHAAEKLGRPRLLYRNQDVRLLTGTISVPPDFEKLAILCITRVIEKRTLGMNEQRMISM